MFFCRNFFFIIIILGFNFSYSIANEKIVFLNLDTVIKESNLGKSITTKLKLLNEENVKDFTSKEKEIKKKEKELINQKNILKKEDFQIKIEALKKEINNFNLDRNNNVKKFQKLKKNELKNFMNQVKPIIEEFVEKKEISLVLNQKNIFIADKKYDITPEIIKLINSKIK